MCLRFLPKILVLFPIALLCVACSSVSPNYLREELANEGPVALSKENPFIAANMFLSLEKDASPLIKKFISYRGEPDAVEIRQEWFSPMRIFFFYMDNREGYVFEERDVAWVIRGPEKIPFAILDKLAGVLPGKPALAQRDPDAPGNPEISIDSYLNQPEEIATEPPVRNKLSETPPSRVARDVVKKEANVPEPTKKAPRTLASLAREKNQQTSGLGKARKVPITASRDIPRTSSSPSSTTGSDVSHMVKYPGETLRIIASWYTGNADNAGRIARINGIENPDMLYLGQEIRLPEYLLKRRNAFPEEEVERYIRELSASP